LPGHAGQPPASTAFAISWRAVPLRLLVVAAAAVVAYHYSLLTLVRGLTLQTPLAYLALVPVLALVLAWVRLSREPRPRPIHDRQLDYIVGIALLAAAVMVALLVPESSASAFWLNRYDLLGLPFFVAGSVALVYGVRRLWALKVPIAFLFLAWPVPYAPLLGDGMRAFADLTASVVASLTAVIPTATAMPGDDTMYFLGSGPTSFTVSIGSACAGVNSVVGFFLVGGALAYVLNGPRWRRIAWLAVGLVVIWLLNVMRIEAIFAVGAVFGQQAALDVLHPVAGLVVFNAGMLAMLLVAERVGLTIGEVTPAAHSVLRTPSPVARLRVPAALAIGLALALGIVNAGYARYEQIIGDMGQAKLEPFDIRTAQLAGWEVQFVGRFDQGKEYFGSSATWDRILYSPTPGAKLTSTASIYVDVIDTADASTFAAYGLEACYRFHGYTVESVVPVDLGIGVQAQVIDYHNTRVGNDWSALWWEWPYSATDGTTRYERIVLFVPNGPMSTFHGYDTAAPASTVPRFEATSRFLVTMARSIVGTHVQQTAAVS
jgi:exosortase